MRIALSYDDNGQVFLYLDEEGREELLAELNALEFPKDRSSHEHFHLMSEHWGMDTLDILSADFLDQIKQKAVHHLRVSMRPKIDHVWAKDNSDDGGH
ncbi:hypothetical protein [uncultured Tateyamaria sp.]|uniref:hypothetical protein n=1 Tax=uncultured Tateyamaria sp. TaxID=455651 RepID=UPI002619F737|nr:hypothetical protein [uncultured Tateyamaria sp.]